MARIDQRERMARLIRKWRSSGQTKADFIRANGVSRGKLEYWVRRLDGAAAGRRGRRQDPLRLIPVQLQDEAASGLGGKIEIVLAGGDRLRVSPAVQAEALRRVIEVLRGAC